MTNLHRAFAAGYDSLSAWADLLDRINVFPVADGDTGANLRISLAPLRDSPDNPAHTGSLLAQYAVGNSGNIAAAFFREFCRSEQYGDLAGNATLGRDKARQALAQPREGTMLDVFDCLAISLAADTDPLRVYNPLCDSMQQTVLATAAILPSIREAGVVDSGALGMFVFFEGFFRELAGKSSDPASIPALFKDKLSISPSFQAGPADSFCVNAVIHAGSGQAKAGQFLAGLGESVVMLPAEEGIKVHIHTSDRQQLRARLASVGTISHWSDEAITSNSSTGPAFSGPKQAVHIMTDGAGSITREMARLHSITLLDSYILAGGAGRPETLCAPEEVYTLMRNGTKVTTAQASVSARHQCYRSVCQQFGPTLYLCVGSVYTGNYAIARQWQEENDSANFLRIIDTGAASGRLGLIALLSARYAQRAASPADVVRFSEQLVSNCREYVFINELQYLVAGGRVSKASGFFGDLLHMKPVISPTAAGVRKVGVVRNRDGQLSFALDKLQEISSSAAAPVIMLQYSDNEKWVRQKVMPRVEDILPAAEILLVPLSLTSGVHMGPGTWSLAWAGAS